MEEKKLQLSKEEGSYLEDVKFAYYAWVNDRTVSLNPVPQEVLLEKYPWADKREENGFERLCLEFFSSSPDVEMVIFSFQIVSTILAELKLKFEEDKSFKPKDGDVIGSFQRLLNAYKCTMLQYETTIQFGTQRVISEAKKRDEKEKGV